MKHRVRACDEVVSYGCHKTFTVAEAFRLLNNRLSSHEAKMKKHKRDLEALHSLQLEKAIRRAEKLEKTLLKIVSQSAPLSPSEAFLKAVQRGVKNLRKEKLTSDVRKPESEDAPTGLLERPRAVKRAAQAKKIKVDVPASREDPSQN